MVQLSQSMRLGQIQQLSPQQILLSTLLQLPLLSLEQKIQTELELNPVLEEGIEEELEQEIEEIEATEEEKEEVEKDLEYTDPEDSDTDLDVKELKEAQEDGDWDELINDEESYEYRLPRDNSEEDFERPEVEVSSMTDHLLEQLNYLPLDDMENQVGEYLIWNIKDDGYLDETLILDNVAEIFECSLTNVEKVLRQIHHQLFLP